MKTETSDLLETSQRAVERATALGADQAEVMAAFGRESRVDLQKNDILNASTAEETIYGIRIVKDGALGFATVNDAAKIEEACSDALALAHVSPPDPLNGLADPSPVTALDEGPDPAIAELGIGELVDIAGVVLDRVQAKDARVMTDSGHVFAMTGRTALATSTGIALEESGAVCGGNLFGMAVQDGEVGSFDHDGQNVLRASDLRQEFEAAADRFVIKTLGALGAVKGESFRGPVILSPEVVSGFIIGNLLSVLNGRAVRTGKSPLKDKLGETIASAELSLVDDPRQPGGVASTAFDREGTPTKTCAILERGVLKSFLYDVYEARSAGCSPTGHARGSASSSPGIGPSNLILASGDQSFSQLCCDPPLAVVVSRFSGSCNPITGEFSGVVKGGFLMRRGEKTPVKETLIAGNLYDSIKNVSGISEETRLISGTHTMPSIRINDVSVTAG